MEVRVAPVDVVREIPCGGLGVDLCAEACPGDKHAGDGGCRRRRETVVHAFHLITDRTASLRGYRESGKLVIACGLVGQAKILILDEPTSALDPETENALFDALDRIGEGRLLVVIAHWLSTIRRADRIVFLDDGALLATGTHDELMQREDGAYRRFVELQSVGPATAAG